MPGFQPSTLDDLPRETHFTAALAFIDLDHSARRLVLCPPDLPPKHLAFADRGTLDNPRAFCLCRRKEQLRPAALAK
jgi:hypothetical protein